MAPIVADIEALEALSRALARTKGEFEVLGLRIRGYEAALGSPGVQRGVDRLTSNWSDVREKIAAELATVSQQVQAAADEYRLHEQQITAGMDQSIAAIPDAAIGD